MCIMCMKVLNRFENLHHWFQVNIYHIIIIIIRLAFFVDLPIKYSYLLWFDFLLLNCWCVLLVSDSGAARCKSNHVSEGLGFEPCARLRYMSNPLSEGLGFDPRLRYMSYHVSEGLGFNPRPKYMSNDVSEGLGFDPRPRYMSNYAEHSCRRDDDMYISFCLDIRNKFSM